MVTVRRLTLELGITGETTFQARLKDFNDSANQLSNTLRVIEQQLLSIGNSLPTTFSAGAGLPIAPTQVLTDIERQKVQQTQELIIKQSEEDKSKKEKQLEIAQQSNDLLTKIITALENQSDARSQIFEESVKTISQEKNFVREGFTRLTGLLDQSLEYVIQAKRPLGSVGRPPKPYEDIYDPEKGVPTKQLRPEFIEYQRPRLDLIKDIRGAQQDIAMVLPEYERQNIDAELDNLIKKYREAGQQDIEFALNQYKKFKIASEKMIESLGITKEEAEKVLQGSTVVPEKPMTQTQTIEPIKPADIVKPYTDIQEYRPEGLSDLPITQRPVIKPIDKPADIEDLDLEAELKKLKEGRATAIEEETKIERPQVKTQEDIDLDELQKQIDELKAQGQVINQPTQIVRPPVPPVPPAPSPQVKAAMQGGIQSENLSTQIEHFMRSAEGGFQLGIPDTYKRPETQRHAIAKYLENEKERKKIKEESDKIRAEMEEEMQHEEEIEKRGFAIPIQEKVRDLQKRATKGWEERKEKWKGKAIGWLGKERKIGKKEFQLIKPAEQYLAETEEARKAKAEEFIEEAEKKEGGIINNYNFNFDKVIVDNEERKQELIRELQLVFRGIR